MKPFLAAFVIAAVTPIAAAQQQPARPNPADPAAPVPAFKYESPFAGYPTYREQQLAPWRDVNDDVARAGGHIGIFGGAGHGATKPAPKPQEPRATPSPKTQPEPAQHGGEHR
jgi:hypothetical protein